MCTVLLPPGGYPIAVNKYTISYQCNFVHHKSHMDWYEIGYRLKSGDRTETDRSNHGKAVGKKHTNVSLHLIFMDPCIVV
jgi:hypothetical protein